MEFPLAAGLLSVILLIGVWGPFVAGPPETPAVDLVWAVVILGIPLVNLLRYKRAPWGCLPLALSVLLVGGLYAAQVDPAVVVGVVVVPNALFLGGELSLGPVLRRARSARLLAELEQGARVERVVELLGDREPEVRTRAAAALKGHPWTQAAPLLQVSLAARIRVKGLVEGLAAAAEDDPATVCAWVVEHVPAANAELQQDLGQLVGFHAGPQPTPPAARVGHALGVLQRDGEAGAKAVVGVLGDASLTPAQRQVALETLDEAPSATLLAAARGALDEGAASAELLWVFHDLGEDVDGPRVGKLLAAYDYDVANAAVDALAGVLGRGPLGPYAAVTLEAVRAAHVQLREQHSAGHNRLADGLAVALEELEADLSPAVPTQ